MAKVLLLFFKVLLFQVVPPINKLVETVPFDAFYYSLDWHPAGMASKTGGKNFNTLNMPTNWQYASSILPVNISPRSFSMKGFLRSLWPS